MHQHLNYKGPRRKRGKESVQENMKRLQLKISPTWKGNSQSSSRGTKSAIQDKPKGKHAKTHTNQTNKERILKAAREKQQVT